MLPGRGKCREMKFLRAKSTDSEARSPRRHVQEGSLWLPRFTQVLPMANPEPCISPISGHSSHLYEAHRRFLNLHKRDRDAGSVRCLAIRKDFRVLRLGPCRKLLARILKPSQPESRSLPQPTSRNT